MQTHHTIKKPIIINVDDLGLSDGVNAAVVELARTKKISATSYMVAGNINQEHKQALLGLDVDVGLHLDFTGITPYAMPLKKILVKSYLRQLDAKQINDAINAQFEQFYDCFGTAPVFVDGHQHVHQFAVIRDALLQQIQAWSHKTNRKIASRSTKPAVASAKAWMIYALGGRRWQQLCQQHHIACNHDFAGVYGFDKNVNQLHALWQKWLAGNSHQPRLIMCHPAMPSKKSTRFSTNFTDDIIQARQVEYKWLMSDAFDQLLAHKDIEIISWSSIYPKEI